MTIFIHSAAAGSRDNSYSHREGFSKEYPLSPESTLKVIFDPIKGASGILKDHGMEMTIPFEEFVGIPHNIKFNPLKLACFLEDTYVKLHRSEDNHVTVVVNQRLRGGGNKHSTHSQSSHYTSPPPPLSTPVNYTAGFPIRSLTLVPQLTGQYVNAKGAPGETQFSVIFQSHDAGARPNVSIHVWKKDFYAAQITQLQATKAGYFQAKTNELEKMQALEGTKNNITKMLESLRDHKAMQRSYSQAEEQLVDEIGVVEKELEGCLLSQKELLQQMEQHGPDIRTLIDLLPVINQLMIPVVQQRHPAIQQFSARDISKDALIGSTSNPNSLLGKTLVSLNTILSDSKKAEGKDIIAVVGNTGTGKSTAVNYLLGIPMQYKPRKEGGIVEVADGQREIAKIGHHLAASETLYTQVYENTHVPFVFADCGGFFDTRGASTDVSVVASLKGVLESAQSVKLVLCFDSRILNSERGRLFHQTMALTLKTLLKNYRTHSGSVLLMLTKPTFGLDNTLFDSKEACGMIAEMMKDLPDGSEQKELYQFLLRENGKYICVCNPLSPDNRDQIHYIFNRMTPIQKTEHAFQVACSAETQVALFEEMSRIAIITHDLYLNHAAITASIEERRSKHQTLKLKLSELHEQKQKNATDMENEEIYLKQHTLAGINESMNSINQQITSLQQQIDSCDAQIAGIDNTQIVVYQSAGGAWTVSDHSTGAPL